MINSPCYGLLFRDNMRHGSLFSGIGGFDLAAEWMGWENIFQVEIDNWCSKLLKQNFPQTKKYNDIKKFNGLDYEGRIDIITGGVPCQPFSVAGERKGEKDERYLFDEAVRVVREISPKFVLFENVKGLLSQDNGNTLEKILTSLEAEGYETQPFIIPASSVGCNHRRDRTWILGWDSNQIGFLWDKGEVAKVSNENTNPKRVSFGKVQPCLDGEFNGIPKGLDTNKRIEGLANAVVPELVYQIFTVIDGLNCQ
jgi:DNA-cytosine methyltransferase